MPPKEYVFAFAHGTFKAAALRVCLETNVTEILAQAGPDGLHVREIGAKSNLDSAKLARIMRYLALHCIYREVAPNIFTNNRLSAVLDTGKSASELALYPDKKHINASGFTAAASFTLGLCAKSATYVLETLRDPARGFSTEVKDSACNRMLGIDVPLWTWWEGPEQKEDRELFTFAVKGYAGMQPADAILQSFPWEHLPQDAVVVDVGGGVGWATLPLAREHPHLRIIIQDQPEIVSEGRNIWSAEFPGAVESQQVQFAAHDFFEPQPIRDASVFFLRYIVHDWPDAYARKILTQLHKAATPQTTLVILDHILPYAPPSNASEHAHAPPPAPLLPNYGGANAMGYALDMIMLATINSQERTIGDVTKLLGSAGWRLERQIYIEGSSGFFHAVHAVPV